MPENIENPNEENSNEDNPENEMSEGEGLDNFDHDQGELAEETVEEIVENLQAEVSELKDRLLRNMAETENVRRRAEKDRTDASAYAVTSFARDMLNVSDNLRRALDSAPEEISEEMKAFAEGVEMTERELINTLDRHGIKQVNPEVGEKFDHNLHQAMFEVPTTDQPNGTVMQVVAPGFVIKGRLLRPAMVGVSKAAPKVDTSA